MSAKFYCRLCAVGILSRIDFLVNAKCGTRVFSMVFSGFCLDIVFVGRYNIFGMVYIAEVVSAVFHNNPALTEVCVSRLMAFRIGIYFYN